MLCICCKTCCLFFFSVCIFGMLRMSVALLLIINCVLKYGLLIFCVLAAQAHCCFTCAFCTVDYECVYTYIED